MSLNLENPKGFLPLLLFVGFIFALIGIGFWTLTTNATITTVGFFVMTIAVALWILVNRSKFQS